LANDDHVAFVDQYVVNAPGKLGRDINFDGLKTAIATGKAFTETLVIQVDPVVIKPSGDGKNSQGNQQFLMACMTYGHPIESEQENGGYERFR
jgi:hypothetical protein